MEFFVPILYDSDGYTYVTDAPLGLYLTYEEAAERIRKYLKQEPQEENFAGHRPYGYIKIMGLGAWDL